MGWNPNAATFKALVGAEDWSVELTQAEFNDFVRMLRQLTEALEVASTELMDEEAIAIDQETELIWMQLNGFPHEFSLSFMLLTGRRAEGHWNTSATQKFIQAIQTIQLF